MSATVYSSGGIIHTVEISSGTRERMRVYAEKHAATFIDIVRAVATHTPPGAITEEDIGRFLLIAGLVDVFADTPTLPYGA